jgi:DegV family protein with EDD domain
MQIVTDSGCDLNLSPEELARLGIHIVPLNVTLGDSTFRESPELDAEGFYQKLESGSALPTTSQPSPGMFADLYRALARSNPSILSIHISSGLSGTLNAARTGAAQVPEAQVKFFDTKTLSVGAGWQVEAAARALHASWPLEQVLSLLERIRANTDLMFTLNDLKYLIHGGRISHMKGLIASVLNIKPIIGVEKEGGTYSQFGQARSFPSAVKTLAGLLTAKLPSVGPLRTQVVHALNMEGALSLQKAIQDRFPTMLLPISRLSLVLGAHTGPTMIGAAVAPAALFESVPT